MFVYYFPDRRSMELADLAELGLGHVFDKPGYSFGRIPKGPDGRGGIVCSYGEQLGYRPDEQTWRQVPGSPAYVGYTTASPPAPESLLRSTALPGRHVELGDGRPWLVPVVRSWRGDEDAAGWVLELPVSIGIDEEGRWTADEVVPTYAGLYRRAIRYFAQKAAAISSALNEAERTDGEPATARVTFTFENLYDLSLELLTTNYRLGKAEVAALGLLTTDVAARIADTAVDWPTLVAWVQKKTPPSCTPTPVGCEASAPGIGPRSPS